MGRMYTQEFWDWENAWKAEKLAYLAWRDANDQLDGTIVRYITDDIVNLAAEKEASYDEARRTTIRRWQELNDSPD